MVRAALHVVLVLLTASLGASCGSNTCGALFAEVVDVVDGDTVKLNNGDSIRYLLVDTPEVTKGKNECYGQEAKAYNTELVLGKAIQLQYSNRCDDRFSRTLAYVTVDGIDVNKLLVERGYGCVLYIPPAGSERQEELLAVQEEAKAAGRGMWGSCSSTPCD